MVTRRTFSEAVRFTVANRPSDQVGERPVGNALAVISSPTTCPTR